MADRHTMPTALHARPLAELPIDELAVRAGELARRWATTLILTRPLEQIGEIPLENIALDGPAVCVQVLRAMESDGELDRLTGTGASSGREGSAPARRLAVIAGARDAMSTVEAVEALRRVLWDSLSAELGEPSSRLLGDASDRLAYVCAAALAVAVAAVAPESVDEQPEKPDLLGSTPWEGRPSPRSSAVIVDEGAQRLDAGSSTLENPAAEPASRRIQIHDQRRGDGPAAWISSIGRQLERFSHDGRPFAVLLVELTDLERLRERERPGETERLAEEVERLLGTELRRRREDHPARLSSDLAGSSAVGSLTRERTGRYWLLAPETDGAGAERLAERLVRAVGSLRSDGGRTLTVAIGTASCPQDGREAAALAAHADVGLYAARSAARTGAGRRPAIVDPV